MGSDTGRGGMAMLGKKTKRRKKFRIHHIQMGIVNP